MAKPTTPLTATTSPTRAPLFRRALKVVIPAHISGAASVAESWSGISSGACGGRNHIVCIAAVVGKASHSCVAACEEISAPTRVSVTTLATMPADSDSLPRLPFNYIFSYFIDNTCDLVTRNSGTGLMGIILLSSSSHCGICRRLEL
jgi:hypothetical protein